MFALSLWHAKGPRARLWMACGPLATFMLAAAVMNACIVRDDRAVTMRMLGHDFLAFYTAGTFVADGRAHQLYDLPAVQVFQLQTARDNDIETGGDFGPFWNPPIYAWVLAPLSKLAYAHALIVWTILNLIALAGAIWILSRMLPRPSALLMGALIVTSAPFIFALSHGQNTCISLLLVTIVVSLWRKRSALLAGICAGLLFFKPQLGAVVALVLVVDLGWRALLGLSISGITMLCINLITLPGTLESYLAQLPRNIHEFQVIQPYMWERHVTLKAFWRLLIDGTATGEMSALAAAMSGICIATLLGGLLWAMVRFRNRLDGESRDRLIAAAFCVMPLIMPFYFDYDLLLLAAPAVLLAGDGAGAGRRLIGAWVALALWMFFNPAFAEATRLNVTVMLLAGISVAMLRRAMRRTKEMSNEDEFLAVDRPVAVDHRRGAVAV